MNELRKVRWYQRWWVILITLLVFLIGGLFGWKWYREWQADRELAQEIQTLTEREPFWEYEEWESRHPMLVDQENLALVALQLKSKLTTQPPNFERLFSDIEFYPALVLNQDQKNMLQTVLSSCKELPAEIEQLLKLKTGVFPVPDFRDARYRIMASQIGRQQELRTVATMLNYYSQWRTEEKDPDAALAASQAILQLGHACEHDPFIITHLVRIAIQSASVQAIERTLAQTQPSAATLAKVQAMLLSEAEPLFIKTAIEGDRAGIDRFLREVGEGRYSRIELSAILSRKPSWRGTYTFDNMLQDFKTWLSSSQYGYVPEERLKSIRFYNAILGRLNQKPMPTLDEIKNLTEELRKDSRTVSLFGGAIPKVYEADLKRRVMLQMTAALLAAERCRLATGKVPAGWSEVVPSFLPAIPIDPYDGKPVRWKQTPTGFVLYSVWMNGTDDGGVIRPGEGASQLDTGVEFFAPEHRRQAARIIRLEDTLAAPLDQKEQYFAAARAGTADKIKELLDAGVDVNTKTEYGSTALCLAAEKGHLDVMKLLIEKKIDLDAKDTFYNFDALAWASMKDQDEAVTLLLKAGMKGESGVLSSAIRQNKPKMAAAALASGRITQETLDSTLKNVDPKKTELVKLLTDAGAKGKAGEALAEKSKTETPNKTVTTPSKTEEALVPTAAAVEPTERVVDRKPWAGFRGRSNAGIADGQYPPTTWDATTGKHLLWKTPIPGLGLSCPIVWDNRLFVTTAINMESPKPSLRIGQYGDVDSVKEEGAHAWKTFCLNAETGKVLWERVAWSGIPKTKRHMKSSHANATPVTDGNHVVVNFGSEGLYCYTMEGQPVWKKELGKLGSSWFFNPEYEWGFGSSPVIYGDTVIVQCDIGKNSFIAAYLLIDGSLVWSTPRDEIPSWCSPTLVQPDNGPAELVTVASKYARGYDPLTGKERWKLGKFSEIAVPTPFYAEGLIYLTTGYRPIQPIYAIKPGAVGDISLESGKESNQSVVWSKTRGGPYLPTPLVYQGHLYVCSNSGVFSCYDAKTGKVIYQKRLGGENGYTASLVAADGRIYCTDEEGKVRVVKAGPEFQLLAINKIGEECLAHPAISNGRIIFRGRDHVLAFGLKANTQ